MKIYGNENIVQDYDVDILNVTEIFFPYIKLLLLLFNLEYRNTENVRVEKFKLEKKKINNCNEISFES